MGQITLDKKKVTINKETQFVLSCYSKALLEAGFTGENSINSNLLITDKRTKTGVKAKLKSATARITNKDHGHEYIELPMIIITFVYKTDSFYKEYIESWISEIKQIDRNKFLPTGDLSYDEITQEKIYSPHVLAMHLAWRLFAFSLSAGEAVNADTQRYHEFLQLFSRKLLGEGCPFYLNSKQLDSVGKYLGDNHNKWLKHLSQLLASRTMFNSHLITFQMAENALSKTEKIITKQLIAYLDKDTKKNMIDDVCYAYYFKEVQQHINKKTKTGKVTTQTLSFSDHKKLPYKAAIIEYVNSKDKKYDCKQIETLYSLLEEIAINRAIVSGVQAFVETTGWLGILTGLIRLDALDERINRFIANVSKTLVAPEKTILKGTTASSALMAVQACNIDDLVNKFVSLSTAFKTLTDPDLMAWVKNEIGGNLKTLQSLQETHDIVIIDMENSNLSFFNANNQKEKRENKKLPFQPQSTHNTTPSISNSADKGKEEASISEPKQIKPLKTKRRAQQPVNSTLEEAPSTTTPRLIEVKSTPTPPPTKDLTDLIANKNTTLLIKPELMEKNWGMAITAIGAADYAKLGQLLLNDPSRKFRDSFKNTVKVQQRTPLPLINVLHNQDKDGLLHWAVVNTKTELVDWLLYYGASIFWPGKDNLTPLTLATDLIVTNGNTLFLKLIKQAQVEATPDQSNIEQFNDLSNLSDKLSGSLYLGLSEYRHILEERNKSWIYPVTNFFASLFSKDHTIQRSHSQSNAYLALVKAETSRDYMQLLEDLKALNKQPNTSGAFHAIIQKTLEQGEEILGSNPEKMAFFDKELREFTPASVSARSGSCGTHNNYEHIALMRENKALKEENAKLKTQLSEGNGEYARNINEVNADFDKKKQEVAPKSSQQKQGNDQEMAGIGTGTETTFPQRGDTEQTSTVHTPVFYGPN